MLRKGKTKTWMDGEYMGTLVDGWSVHGDMDGEYMHCMYMVGWWIRW